MKTLGHGPRKDPVLIDLEGQSLPGLSFFFGGKMNSSGPRTPVGKQRSKRNSITHGIFSKVMVLQGESQADFDALLKALHQDRQPVRALEEILVTTLASLFWRLRR